MAILAVGWLAAKLLKRITKKLLSWTGLLAIFDAHGIDNPFVKPESTRLLGISSRHLFSGRP